MKLNYRAQSLGLRKDLFIRPEVCIYSERSEYERVWGEWMRAGYFRKVNPEPDDRLCDASDTTTVRLALFLFLRDQVAMVASLGVLWQICWFFAWKRSVVFRCLLSSHTFGAFAW